MFDSDSEDQVAPQSSACSSYFAHQTEQESFWLEMLQCEVECLRQELHERVERQQHLEQELQFSNKDLEQMNQEIFELMTAKRVALDEAKHVAQTLLAQGCSTEEALAKLLSAIYGVAVVPQEFRKTQHPTAPSSAPLERASDRPTRYSARQAKFRNQYFRLGLQFATSKAQHVNLQEQSDTFKTWYIRLRNQIDALKEAVEPVNLSLEKANSIQEESISSMAEDIFDG